MNQLPTLKKRVTIIEGFPRPGPIHQYECAAKLILFLKYILFRFLPVLMGEISEMCQTPSAYNVYIEKTSRKVIEEINSAPAVEGTSCFYVC